MKKKKYWTQKTKKSFVIPTMKNRFGLVEPITYERQAKKFMRDFEKRMKSCGIEVQCVIQEVKNA